MLSNCGSMQQYLPIMLPVKHMLNYEDFKTVLMEGFFLGQEFLKDVQTAQAFQFNMEIY